MKYLLIFFIFITSYVSAQVPQTMNYQGILRNASGQAVSMKTINVQVSITSDKNFSISNLLYSEKFTVLTNEFGTYAIPIGYGKPITGTFGGIDWSTGKHWVFVEVDENLNNIYEFVGSMQFASVPYALYANSAKIADSVRNAVGIQGPKGATGAAGTNGTNGATWFTGTVVPATTTGVLNDLYLNTTNGDYYKKTGTNVWTLQANLTGPQGPQGLTGATGPQGPTGSNGAAGTSGANGTSGIDGATWYTGSGTATATTGVVNDLYLNKTSGDYYKKTSTNTWTLLGNLSTGATGATGPQGIQGPAGATGATGPAGAAGAQGIQGIAGPTGATGANGSAGTNGANGSTWFTGTVAPSTGTGVVNDFYLNTSNGDYYKKTGVSVWTLQANLTGPQGATGLTGATGAQGPQGLQGVAGPTGATGATGAAGSNATITMGTIAATSNVNGGTITSGVLTLTPADATNGGVLTTGVQSITGTKTFVNNLKTNGTFTAGAITYPNVDGTAGQVLSTTGAGTLTWTSGSAGSGGASGARMQVFTAGTYNWTVPAGVTSVIVEMWGGGGAGNINLNAGFSGGAGGYGKGPVSVTPGNVITITVGHGAPGAYCSTVNCQANSSSDGENTSFGGIVTATGGISGNDWPTGQAASGTSNCLISCTSSLTKIPCVQSVGVSYGVGSSGKNYYTNTYPNFTADGKDGFLILTY